MSLTELDSILITYDFDVYDGEHAKVFDCEDETALNDPDRAISSLMREYGHREVYMVVPRGEWSGGGLRYGIDVFLWQADLAWRTSTLAEAPHHLG